MSDITKCSNGENCFKKGSCYRWISDDSDWQSCCDFYEEGIECEYYIDVNR